MKEIKITDFDNIRVGQASDTDAATGVTVAIFDKGACTGASIIGGAPGTRETDLLRPENMIDKVHAVFLTGGSAFGLDASSGIMKYLSDNSIGFDTGTVKVPIVCGSVLYDIEVGSPDVYPDQKMGYLACENSEGRPDFLEGNYGAGTGCSVGKLAGIANAKKSGIGYYGVEIGGLKVGAIVAVNAFGSILEDGSVIAGPLDNMSTVDMIINGAEAKFAGKNTTIGMVFTNAAFDKAELTKIASMTHDAMARCINPTHTLFDGDSIYAISLSDEKYDNTLVGVIAQEVFAEAILRAVKKTRPAYGLKNYLNKV